MSKSPEIGFDSWRFVGYNTILSGFSIFHTQKEKIGSTWGKVSSGNDNFTFSHSSYCWDVSQHMEKDKAQNGLEKAILCLIVFPIKIKEKENVRLRNLRSRITFPLNLIYPPSQSMQFHPSQTS